MVPSPLQTKLWSGGGDISGVWALLLPLRGMLYQCMPDLHSSCALWLAARRLLSHDSKHDMSVTLVQYLVVHSASNSTATAAAAAAAAGAAAGEGPKEGGGEAETGMCGVCHDPLEQPVAASCGHAFCRVRNKRQDALWPSVLDICLFHLVHYALAGLSCVGGCRACFPGE